MKIGEGINENQGDVAKQTRNKVEAFMKNISNIYSEVYIEFQVSQEKIVKTLTDLVKMGGFVFFLYFYFTNQLFKTKKYYSSNFIKIRFFLFIFFHFLVKNFLFF